MGKNETRYYSNDEFLSRTHQFEELLGRSLSKRQEEVVRIYLTIDRKEENKIENKNPQASRLLQELFFTPPLTWSQNSENKPFETIEPAVKGYLQRDIALIYALQLLRSVGLSNYSGELPLSDLDPMGTYPEPEIDWIRALYESKGRGAEFERLFKEQLPGARQIFLDALTKSDPEIPLIQYASTIAKNVIDLQESSDKKYNIGTLDTRIPGVRLQYRYPKTGNAHNPQRVLIIEGPTNYFRRK